jgi:hypothetical protein
MTKVVSTRTVAKALRSEGHSVVTGRPKNDDMSNFWVLSKNGNAVVLNVQTFSILGNGCYHHPDYNKTKAELMEKAKDLLQKSGIEFTPGIASDQLFLSGYRRSPIR